jgi:nitrite reductase (NADH) large subunit
MGAAMPISTLSAPPSLGPESATAAVAAPIIIIGNGPVGLHAAAQLLRHEPQQRVVIYGREPCQPYNRVKLSSLLSGADDLPGVTSELPHADSAQVEQRFGYSVTAINPAMRSITDSSGRVEYYRKLILALGSTPRIPAIGGLRLDGIFTFHNLRDAEQLIARRIRSRRTIVIGGGLLGLEAARGMQRSHTEVAIIDHADRLLSRQLDPPGSLRLLEHVESLGISVLLNSAVKSILGENSVTGIELCNGHSIACDTVIIATGTTPNIALARAAGIRTARGIVVNDAMQTSSADIYAVGECAEHHQRVYGLVAPGLEQAAVAVHHICAGAGAYHGTIASASLKVLGENVFSIGAMTEPPTSPLVKTYSYSDARHYRSIRLRRSTIIGAVAVGDWPQQQRIHKMVSSQARLMPWQLWRFHASGRL